MFRVEAIFTGKDSLGFLNKKLYKLILEVDQSGIVIKCPKLRCVYSNIQKFIDNWNIKSFNKISDKPYFLIEEIKNCEALLYKYMRDNKLHILLYQ